jgi:hypothetical protein
MKQDYRGVWKEIFPMESDSEFEVKTNTFDVVLQPLEGKVFTRIKDIR